MLATCRRGKITKRRKQINWVDRLPAPEITALPEKDKFYLSIRGIKQDDLWSLLITLNGPSIDVSLKPVKKKGPRVTKTKVFRAEKIVTTSSEPQFERSQENTQQDFSTDPVIIERKSGGRKGIPHGLQSNDDSLWSDARSLSDIERKLDSIELELRGGDNPHTI